MNRRDLLRDLGLAAAAMPLMASAFCAQGATLERVNSSAAFVLPKPTRRVVGVIADLIIPQTDTAAASGAGVIEFIELMLGEWFSPDERAEFLEGLGSLDRLSREQCGAGFLSAGVDNQTKLLILLENQALQADSGSLDPKSLIARIKLLVVTGYYTSEVGASVELDNTMIFQSYEGCVTIGPNDRAQSMSTPAPRAL